MKNHNPCQRIPLLQFSLRSENHFLLVLQPTLPTASHKCLRVSHHPLVGFLNCLHVCKQPLRLIILNIPLQYIICFPPGPLQMLHVQSCPTLCHPMECSPPGSSVHGIFQARKGCHFLLQGIFPTQGLNPSILHLLHWQMDSLPLCHLLQSLFLKFWQALTASAFFP